ncbi:cytochrome P450 [Chitinophaga nivalis]|uniref:Cytochrome P450 n=1 Tax=Chitinophaga nivalis TaxID=2991709 RepID=A0ABT3IMV0_9BACT|nr:cytochrome P450 [Chitinophaga nivalis]MCW3465017.1 cytochrome P450 [Chitinophaga nivalis]MCW3485291.1 cytochrome P450 [Chitinophaga nivalis]
MQTINFFSEAYQENPYYYYQLMHEQQPLFFHEPTNSYVISLYEDVERAFKDPTFTSHNYSWQVEPLHGVTMIQMDGREHSRSRNVVVPSFRGKELMEQTLPCIKQNAASLLEHFNGRNVVELRDEFTNIFPIKVIVSMLGLPEEDIVYFHKWYNCFARHFENISNNETVLQAAKDARDEFQAYLSNIIDDRIGKQGNDLLTILCNAEIDGVQMDKRQIMGFCGLLLQAGGETTDKAIANMFRNLLSHPDQLALLQQDRSLMDRAITESLRCSPPAHMILRVTSEKVQLSSGEIPANATVVCMIAAANRDKSKFENPDEFNILRKELETKIAYTGASNMATFGYGRHFCVGAQLSKMEMQVAAEMLLDYMEELAFADDTIPKEIGIFSRYPQSLRVKFKARNSIN